MEIFALLAELIGAALYVSLVIAVNVIIVVVVLIMSFSLSLYYAVFFLVLYSLQKIQKKKVDWDNEIDLCVSRFKKVFFEGRECLQPF